MIRFLVVVFTCLSILCLTTLVLVNVKANDMFTRVYLPAVLDETQKPIPTATHSFTPTQVATPSATLTITPIPSATPIITPTPTKPACAVLGGIISSDLTLTGNCEYSVTRNTLVEADATLIINAGAIIRFLGPYYMKVDGVIQVNGNPSEPVRFTSGMSIPNPGDWVGLHIVGSKPSSITNAILEYAGGDSDTIWGALRLQGGAHLAEQVIVQRNLDNVVVLGSGGVQMKDSVLQQHNIDTPVVRLEGLSGALFSNNRIIDNTGVVIAIIGEDTLFENNTIENNISYGGTILGLYQGQAVGNLFRGNLVDGGSLIHVIGEVPESSITCNTFVDNEVGYNGQKNGSIIVVESNYNLSINNNNFLNGERAYDIFHKGYFELDATQNYWGTTSQDNISARIFDYYDDFNLRKVNYLPLLDVISLCAPEP